MSKVAEKEPQISEEEEFEFRLRAEQEADASSSSVSESVSVEETPMKLLPSSMEETISEAKAIKNKALAGVTMGLSEVGLKTESEAIAGEVGKNARLGSLLTKNIKDRIKAFSMSGMINPETYAVEDDVTLHEKYGIPVPPQPETGIGKILGLGAEVVGGLAVSGLTEKRINTPKLKKLPSVEKIDDAMTAVESNIKTRLAQRETELKEATTRTSFQETLENINDSKEISRLSNDMADTAYAQAEAVHGKPGDIGLGVKASKNLNKAYWKDAEPYFNKQVAVEDVAEGVRTSLQRAGILDGKGDLIPGADISPQHAKALKFYDSLGSKDPEGVVDFGVKNVKKMKVGDLKKNLETSFGKGHGSDTLVNEVFQNVGEYVDELKKVNMKYVTDYQARNAVYDKFNIFNRMGWRRGDVSLNGSAKLLENLASKDPASVNRDSIKLMDFLKRYTGEDPSMPVKGVSKSIQNVELMAEERKFRNMNNLDRMAQKIVDDANKSKANASMINQNLSSMREYVANKEGFIKRIKDAGIGLVKIGVGSQIAKTGIGVIQKLAK